MSIIFRFTERGDGGALGPTRSEPFSIDREKRCFRLKLITPSVTSLIVANILHWRDYICVMVTSQRALDRL
jgi:hypothetical protein